MNLFRTFLSAGLGLVMAAGAFADGPYQILKSVPVGGPGGYDYVYADQGGRKLYIPRLGDQGRITVYNLDTLEPAGVIKGVNAHGVAVSARSNHGFASGKPLAMWDATTLLPIKTISVDGSPDGILYEPYGDEIWVFSHKAPNLTVVRGSDGGVVGSFDLGGSPEQAVSDGQGRVYVDIEDKDEVAVVDAATLGVLDRYSLGGQGSECAGLAFDPQNRILFAACRKPAVLVVLGADDGKVRATLPIGSGCDGALFNPATGEVFTSAADGTLTVIRELSPTEFAVEQTLNTAPNARTSTLDPKTGKVYLVAADFGPAPADQAAGPGHQRGPMVPGSFKILEVGE